MRGAYAARRSRDGSSPRSSVARRSSAVGPRPTRSTSAAPLRMTHPMRAPGRDERSLAFRRRSSVPVRPSPSNMDLRPATDVVFVTDSSRNRPHRTDALSAHGLPRAPVRSSFMSAESRDSVCFSYRPCPNPPSRCPVSTGATPHPSMSPSFARQIHPPGKHRGYGGMLSRRRRAT